MDIERRIKDFERLLAPDAASMMAVPSSKEFLTFDDTVGLCIQELPFMGSGSLKVISVGINDELLWLRNAVLRNAGFQVLTSSSESDVLNFIEQGNCGVLLMCYSLSYQVRRRLAEAFRKRCPHNHIVAITNRALEKPDFADGFVYGLEGPEALIDAIRNI